MPIRILIFDRVGFRAFEQTLIRGGYDVLTVTSAQAAWEEIESICPHVLLLDLSHIAPDDLEFLRQLRSNPALAKLHVAVMSSDYFQTDLSKEQLDEIQIPIWFKPLWAEDLFDKIRGFYSIH